MVWVTAELICLDREALNEEAAASVDGARLRWRLSFREFLGSFCARCLTMPSTGSVSPYKVCSLMYASEQKRRLHGKVLSHNDYDPPSHSAVCPHVLEGAQTTHRWVP